MTLLDEVERLRAEVAVLEQRATEAEDILRAAFMYVHRAAEGEPMYGFFPGGDPRTFTPDEESATPAELEAWKRDCARWNAGEQTPTPPCCQVEVLPSSGSPALVTRSYYGPGTCQIYDVDACNLRDRIQQALAPAEVPR